MCYILDELFGPSPGVPQSPFGNLGHCTELAELQDQLRRAMAVPARYLGPGAARATLQEQLARASPGDMLYHPDPYFKVRRKTMDQWKLEIEAISGHLIVDIGGYKGVVHDKKELKVFASKTIDKLWDCLGKQLKESKK